MSHKAPKQYRKSKEKRGVEHWSLTVRKYLTDETITSQTEVFQGWQFFLQQIILSEWEYCINGNPWVIFLLAVCIQAVLCWGLLTKSLNEWALPKKACDSTFCSKSFSWRWEKKSETSSYLHKVWKIIFIWTVIEIRWEKLTWGHKRWLDILPQEMVHENVS